MEIKNKKRINFTFLLIVMIIASIVGTFTKEIFNNTSNTDDKDKLIEASQKSFVDSCVNSGGDSQICTCVFKKVVEEYGIDNFTKNNHSILSNDKNNVKPEYIEFLFKTAPKLCSGM